VDRKIFCKSGPRILGISTRCSCQGLLLLQANTYEIIQYEFLREFKKNNFRPFAAAPSKCRPVRPAPPSLRHAVQTSASYHGIDTRLYRARGKYRAIQFGQKKSFDSIRFDKFAADIQIVS